MNHDVVGTVRSASFGVKSTPDAMALYIAYPQSSGGVFYDLHPFFLSFEKIESEVLRLYSSV